MQSVVSALPNPFEQQALELWELLEVRFGTKRARTSLLPHMTWQVGVGPYDLQKVLPLIDEISRNLQPIPTKVIGVSDFPGESAVIYLRVFKNNHLKSLHTYLWKLITPWLREPNLLYSPHNWVPHIAMVWGDLETERKSETMRFLHEKDVNWSIPIDNFVILDHQSNQIATCEYRFQFGKGILK